MTWCKFITNLWDLDRSHFYFYKSITRIVLSKHDLVNHTCFWVSERFRSIFCGLFLTSNASLSKLSRTEVAYFTNDNIISTDLSTRWNKTIDIKLIVWTMLAALCYFGIRFLKFFTLSCSFIVCSEEYRTEESSINSRLINHNRILLIVPRVTCNSHYRISSRW